MTQIRIQLKSDFGISGIVFNVSLFDDAVSNACRLYSFK